MFLLAFTSSNPLSLTIHPLVPALPTRLLCCLPSSPLPTSSSSVHAKASRSRTTPSAWSSTAGKPTIRFPKLMNRLGGRFINGVPADFNLWGERRQWSHLRFSRAVSFLRSICRTRQSKSPKPSTRNYNRQAPGANTSGASFLCSL